MEIVNAFLDAAISSRAVPGDAMALTPAERLIVQALIIDDATPFSGADIAAILADTDTIAWGDITTLLTRLSAARAGYLDELDFDLQATLNTIAGYIDAEIAAIIADIGVFPTANYATLAAYVEDIRTRLIAILAATATLITSVVPKATDEQDSFTWDTSVYLTNETDISALFTTPLTGATRRRYSLFLDLTGPAGDAAAWTKCTLKVKVEVDGANPRTVDKKEFAKTDVAAAEEPGVNIDIPALAKDVQITMQFDVALGGDQTIYYTYVEEVLE